MWIKFALIGTLLTFVFHITVLLITGQDPVTTPVSALSQHELGELQSSGLVLFGLAHVALAFALTGFDRGRLWPLAQGLLTASGIGLVYVAWYFANSTTAQLGSPQANDPLWIVASLTGAAMGALQPGLARLSRGLGLFSALCLGVWLLLIPLILLVNDSWIGAYERLVGAVYVTWVAGISFGLLKLSIAAKADA